ncbi:hypothetical protein A7K93_10185 [Candidatus Methylacidiphilum fumarolicum]|uniref:Transposase n=2 Tax=Candidatus Methylacidiphilum fumarolicum TaxID=591154 RepID=I0JZY6_METFB|nr:hypothetical protein A7K93_10185 [Candidatus Methylacidiphilum fumarolicum]TFE71876.1 hypothetical protein A7K72_10035 [Candidatus Methylacidiphilum fumarolicum]TFE76453.1 hypothetical protein A7D33_10040 [Candidatus Methylacidiphilum fumarolicum]CAI9086150.1 conserved protein of unknown function [Candidatus Methylacidiphilum fumarolicum]CCG92805.1 hypothetical protein MFUM_800020 [Methylacidiphilum fumariolicum SolV]
MVNWWFVSVPADTDAIDLRPAENQGAIGVDLGMSAMASLSRGKKIIDLKPHSTLLKQLR